MASEIKEAEQKWFMKDFPKYYQSYAKVGATCHERLLGWHEHQNQLSGYDIGQATYLIGTVADEIKLLGLDNEAD